MTTKPSRVVLVGLVVVAGIAAATFAWSKRQPPVARAIPGMVRQTEIRIAPEVSGRLGSIAVAPGQHVHRGDVVAVIDNPDLVAAVGEARAAAASAEADRARVLSGTRPEQVAILAQALATAEANLLLAQQQNVRAVTLSSNSFLSRQKLDESMASLAKAQADVDVKKNQYAAAKAGPVDQERALAIAKVALSHAALDDLQARLDKVTLRAPADGMIGVQVAEIGEIMAPGKPVMTMVVDGEPWFAFTLREDMLRGSTIGHRLALATADGRQVDARVTELKPLGEFATWRAARAVGDHDLNSFGLRLEPVGTSNPPLEPGMTVWLPGS
ncbi:biotin/lipoyl-binding protein [Lichenihabitans sp. PAMC28606]|uniref:HlyD family secretion protein n=1 Tax=Lichenihabitans sp. PAMC28606 TaxID=2880932 RepID=UPI001D09AFD5|nr:biotin/lipoyl-binding protein [Lichenihabitans sp. PAMC28606]UDL93117.1 biotin/lipoyl-binding protein [Lichenihabitans sp. PAMC28606]